MAKSASLRVGKAALIHHSKSCLEGESRSHSDENSEILL
jgi:hypothetical protein